MKTPKRRSPPAKELGDPKYRARTEDDRTKYDRKRPLADPDHSWEAGHNQEEPEA